MVTEQRPRRCANNASDQVSLYPTPVGNPVAQPLQAPAGRRYSSIEEPDVLPITE